MRSTTKSSVQMKETGAQYPNCIPGMEGWQYVLSTPYGLKGFGTLSMARAFADRIARMVPPAIQGDHKARSDMKHIFNS